jgi:acetyl esterase/lipase
MPGHRITARRRSRAGGLHLGRRLAQLPAAPGRWEPPYAAPGQAYRLAGLPPTLLITAQDDPLRDETLAYAARLRAAGLAARDVVLPVPTGWPCSYLEPAGRKTAWGPILHEQFSGFLNGALAPQDAHTVFPGTHN